MVQLSEDVRPAVGFAVAARRRALRISQEELAQRAGLSRGQVAQLELDIIHYPKLDTLLALAKALETTLGNLLRDAGLLPRDDNLEAQIADLIMEVPGFAELFSFARDHQAYLDDLVAFAEGILAAERHHKGEAGAESPPCPPAPESPPE